MPRFAQMVIGPAGCGKSTYCHTMQTHFESIRRSVKVVNLDPAAEYFAYEPSADIKDLIELDDTMEDEELSLGPNGGLLFCMEFLTQNFDWIDIALGEDECDYILFDCPGQIELYSHLPVMPRLIEYLQRKWDFRIVTVFIIDARFLVDSAHFISGILSALSSMVVLSTAHINLMSKIDMLSENQQKLVNARYLDPNMNELCESESGCLQDNHKLKKLNSAIARMIENFSMVQFLPFNRDDEETIQGVLMQIDNCLQYDETVDTSNRFYDDAEKDIHGPLEE